MSFGSESEAKRFFVQKVVGQAEREGITLSKAERHMLNWSESDPAFEPDAQLEAALEDKMSDDECEAKISGLFKRAYDQDVAEDKYAKAQYRDAYSKLNEGDHYILVMIKQALGLRVRSWWPF